MLITIFLIIIHILGAFIVAPIILKYDAPIIWKDMAEKNIPNHITLEAFTMLAFLSFIWEIVLFSYIIKNLILFFVHIMTVFGKFLFKFHIYLSTKLKKSV